MFPQVFLSEAFHYTSAYQSIKSSTTQPIFSPSYCEFTRTLTHPSAHMICYLYISLLLLESNTLLAWRTSHAPELLNPRPSANRSFLPFFDEGFLPHTGVLLFRQGEYTLWILFISHLQGAFSYGICITLSSPFMPLQADRHTLLWIVSLIKSQWLQL